MSIFLGGHLQISVSLCKDEPETVLLSLMRSEGVKKIRTVLASYVDFLKTGKSRWDAKISTMHISFISIAATALSIGCGLLYSVVEFTQGMILPTANGVSKQQTAQATTKSNKTQVSYKLYF